MRNTILRFSSTVIHAAIVFGLILALSNQVWAGNNQGAKKELLVGPQAVIWCDDLTPVPGEDSSQIQDGFVIFNYDDDWEMLIATVKLKGAEPYTDYPVRLIQSTPAGDCFVVDATIITNRKGNGVAHIEEPGVGDAAQVIIDTGTLTTNPTWRATNIFYFYP